MLGRSSRTRNVCCGTLYVSSGEKASVVIDKLKRQNFSAMASLEKVMILLEKRFKDAGLVSLLKKELDKGHFIKSVDEV